MALTFGPSDLNLHDLPEDGNSSPVERRKNAWEHHNASSTAESSEDSEDGQFASCVQDYRHVRPVVIQKWGERVFDLSSKYCDSDRSHGPREDFRAWENFKSSSVPYVLADAAEQDAFTRGSSPRPPSLVASEEAGSDASDLVPALVSEGAQSMSTSTDSVNTGLASVLGGVNLLDEVDEGILVAPATTVPDTYYVCIFHLLDCQVAFHDVETWRIHMLSHFRGHASPTKAQCPYCPWKTSHAKRDEAWNRMLTHVSTSHSLKAGSVEQARPDFDLFKFLWNRRIISDVQYRTLVTRAKAWFYKPKSVPDNFLSLAPCKIFANEKRARRAQACFRRPNFKLGHSPVPCSQEPLQYRSSRSAEISDRAESNDIARPLATASKRTPSPSKSRTSWDRSRNRAPKLNAEAVEHEVRTLSRSVQDETNFREEAITEMDSENRVSASRLSDMYRFKEDLEETTESLLERTKRFILENLMEEFYVEFGHLLKGRARMCANPSDNDASKASRSTSNEAGSSDLLSSNQHHRNTRLPSRKRGREGDDQKPNERNRPTPAFGSSRRLACPFHKHDPVKYTCNSITGSKYRTCAGPGFETISRTKEHLYRTHTAPVQCPRCWICLKDFNDLKLHLNQEIRCEAWDSEERDGVTAEQLEKLKCKKRPVPDQTDESRWNEIYAILFPKEPLPSPYYDWDILEDSTDQRLDFELQCFEDFKEYSRIYLPVVVESKLETFLLEKLEPLREELKSALSDVVKSSISDIYEDWQTKRTHSFSSGPGNESGAPGPTSDPTLPDEPDLGAQNVLDVNLDPFFQELPMYPCESFAPPLGSANPTCYPQYPVDSSDSGYASQHQLTQMFSGYHESANNDLYLPEFPEAQNSQRNTAFPSLPELLKPPEWQFNMSSFPNGLSEDEAIFVCPHNKGKGNANTSAPTENTACTFCLGAA